MGSAGPPKYSTPRLLWTPINFYSKITWLHLSSKMFIEHDDPLHMKPFLRMFNQGNSVAFDEEILFCVKSSQSEKGMKF